VQPYEEDWGREKRGGREGNRRLCSLFALILVKIDQLATDGTYVYMYVKTWR
jgi:hypothetical protein